MKKPPKETTVVKRKSAQKRQALLDREAAASHARFLHTLDRIDRERAGQPHRPALVNETLRRDDDWDWDAAAIRALSGTAGPRTGTHPQATLCVRRPVPEPGPQATRTRPTALEDIVPSGPRLAGLAVAISAALILSAVAGAVWLAR